MLRDHGAEVRSSLPWPQRRLLDRLPVCRTPALGGRVHECASCGHAEVRFHSCQDRHCPTCSGARTARWLQDRQSRLLPVPHFHVVFTLPEQLRPLARAAPAVVYDLLMSAAVRSLQAVLQTEHQARFAITAVLHTWTRELLLHPHVHVIVSAGGLSLDDRSWAATSESFLVSNRKLAPLFAGKLLSGLRRARKAGELELDGPLEARWEHLLDAAAGKTWVVYVDAPKRRSPGALLRYLGRYLFRVAVDDRRLVAYDGRTVTMRTRDKATTSMPGPTFVRRFVQHALPRGFRKIRHYGLLAPGNVGTRLARAFELLDARPSLPPGGPAPDPTCDPNLEPRPRCPRCGERAVHVWELPPMRGPPTFWARGRPAA